MKDFLSFLFALGDELYDLFAYTRSIQQQADPEQEKQLAMAIVRKASDERMKRDLGG